MSLCSLCGASLNGEGLCPWHYHTKDTWAFENKTWCDFFHRGVDPPRLDVKDRYDAPLVVDDVA